MNSREMTRIPDDVPSSLRAVATEWEHFVDTGKLIDNNIRPVIADSWLRSRQLGINPFEERARSVISADEIDARLHSENFGISGKIVLDRMAQIVEDTAHVIVLADATGRILYSVGHNTIQDHLEKINFMPGSQWSEDVAGPNGIGTPLVLGHPELVMGAEHFCQGWQPWVCYGAPVHNPVNRSMLGCVDITGPADQLCAEAMALAISITLSIEANLSITQLKKREYLRQAYRDILMRYPNDASLMLDENGYVVDVSSSAGKLLNTAPTELLQTAFDKTFPDLWIDVKLSLRDGLERESEVRLKSALISSAPCYIKPVEVRGERLGCAVIFNRGNTINRTRQGIAKLAIANGNVAKYSFDQIIGKSTAFKETIRLAKIAAKDTSNNSVFLIGETGTGKELIAHAIHSESQRSDAPFIAINCAALPRDLVESELFGYATGAFTGAKKEGMPGKFESAHTGTLFLDEIDSLDIGLQAKFLRVLDDMQITRLGEINSRSLDVRIIAATGTDLSQAISERKFREDLFHRLNVIEINMPPLRRRDEDILLLIEHFLHSACATAQREPLVLSPEVRDRLLHYGWPGNIRELRNLCSRWVLTVTDQRIALGDLGTKLIESNTTGAGEHSRTTSLRDIGDDLIRDTLAQTGGNISKAARILNINRATIYRRSKS